MTKKMKEKFKKFVEQAQKALKIKPKINAKGDIATFEIKGKELCVLSVNENQTLIEFGSNSSDGDFFLRGSSPWKSIQELGALLQKKTVVKPRRKEQSLQDWLNEQNITVDNGEARVQICASSGSLIYDEPIDLDVEIRPHPEGSDRGGYVPYVLADGEEAMWCETGGEWY
jgi:hypothetical protein